MFRSLGWRPITIFALSLVGLGLSIFLTYGHYFDQAAITNTCPGGIGGTAARHGAIDCGLVTTSKWSVVFGIPVAVYGLVFFVFMTVINLPSLWRTLSQLVARLRLAASVLGIVGVLYLVGVEALAIHAICIYCTGVHIATFAIFLLVATGWQDTGWARFVEAYEAEQAETDEKNSLEARPEDPVGVNRSADRNTSTASRRAPRPSRYERKRASSRG